MIVRRLESHEAHAYFQLRLRGLKESPAAFGSTYEEEVDFTDEQIEARCRPHPENFMLGAFDQSGSLVGIAGFVRSNRVKTRHKGSLVGMYVAPEFRGQGIGRSIVNAVIEMARAQEGLEQITLTVETDNEPARQLYLSLGFEVFGFEKNASKHHGQYTDEETMALRLI